MKLSVEEMTKERAMDSLQWTYEPPYDFYNVDCNEETILERMDGSFQTVIDEDRLIGFFCTGDSARVPAGEDAGVYHGNAVDLGLGMNPEWTGRGNGYAFGSFIIDHILSDDSSISIRLSVATFNKRAIRLYENLGFIKDDSFRTDTCEFITMIRNT
jgi:[ribosomal protein S18]-alanine N-acetyltransferase